MGFVNEYYNQQNPGVGGSYSGPPANDQEATGWDKAGMAFGIIGNLGADITEILNNIGVTGNVAVGEPNPSAPPQPQVRDQDPNKQGIPGSVWVIVAVVVAIIALLLIKKLI